MFSDANILNWGKYKFMRKINLLAYHDMAVINAIIIEPSKFFKTDFFMILFLKKIKKKGGIIIYGRLVYLVKRQRPKDKP